MCTTRVRIIEKGNTTWDSPYKGRMLPCVRLFDDIALDSYSNTMRSGLHGMFWKVFEDMTCDFRRYSSLLSFYTSMGNV